MKVAEALVLRNHLKAKVEQLRPLKINGDNGLFELKTQRKSVSENVDEVTTQVARVTLKDVTEEYDKYSKALRQLDTKIQEANWVNSIDFDEEALAI